MIEAEAFDEGPRGKAWRDRTPENDLGAFRDTGVDIESTTDVGGGYHIGSAEKGEWVEYTIEAPSAGAYTIDLRYAADTGFGGSVRADVDGRKAMLDGSIDLPATGGWSVWETAAGGVNLKAGIQVLRLTFDTAANPREAVANLNWFRLTPASPATVVLSAPLKKASLTPHDPTDRIFEAIFTSSPSPFATTSVQ